MNPTPIYLIFLGLTLSLRVSSSAHVRTLKRRGDSSGSDFEEFENYIKNDKVPPNRNFKDYSLIYPWINAETLPIQPIPHMSSEDRWNLLFDLFIHYCENDYSLAYDQFNSGEESQVTPIDETTKPNNCAIAQCIPPLGNPPPGETDGCCEYLDPRENRKVKCYGLTVAVLPSCFRVLFDEPIYHFEMEHTSISKIDIFNKPINIRVIHLNNNKIRHFSPSAFKHVSGMAVLKLNDNQLSYILPQNFKGLDSLTTLELQHNMIELDRFDACENTTEDDIEPVLPSLILLNLEGNPLKKIPRLYFAGLRNSTKFTSLNLRSCQLEYIDPNNMKYLSHLVFLDLSRNPKLMSNLEEVMKSLRSTMTSDLKYLYLSLNDLPGIPTSSIAPFASTIVELSLDFNMIEIIEDFDFPRNMTALTSLKLNDNRIKYIGDSAFKDMINLRELILENNRLMTVPYTISFTPKLRVLDMSNNPGEFIEQGVRFRINKGAFINNSEIEVLDFDNCPLDSLEPETFAGLIKVKHINMSSCEITEIHDFAFQHTKSLENLFMRNNPLKTVNEYTFFGLASLQKLYIDGCKLSLPLNRKAIEADLIAPPSDSSPDFQNPLMDFITVVQLTNRLSAPSEQIIDLNGTGSVHSPFRYTYRLESIFLANNEFRTLCSKMFSGIQYLEEINLNSNKIESWDDPVFLNASIGKIDLSNNRIMSLTEAMIEDFTKIAEEGNEINLSDNPLICSTWVCAFKALLDDYNETSWLMDWNSEDSNAKYMCYFTHNRTSLPIRNLTPELCKFLAEEMATTPPPKPDEHSGSGDSGVGSTIPGPLVALIISLTVISLLVGSIALGYKKRLHLRYMLNFKFRINKGQEEKLIGESDLDGRKDYEYDIFISYSHQDQEFVQDQLVPEIEGRYEGAGRTLRICLHERDFEVGVPITENIVECVDKSRKVLAVISRKYLDSQWCLFEMNLIYHRLVEKRRKAFLVILLEEIPSFHRTKILNYLMGSKTYLLWPKSSSNGIEQASFWTRLRNSLI